MYEERSRSTIELDQDIWEHLMGGQSPREFEEVARASGIVTLGDALADLRNSPYWQDMVAEYGTPMLLASLARTLVYETDLGDEERDDDE